MYFLGIAQAVALRADCTNRQVGAVIVRDHRIVATGYNGAPSGMPGCMTDNACPRSVLRNEMMAGLKDLAQQAGLPEYDEGPGTCIAVHAEANALIYADYSRCVGATLYCTDKPCPGCMKLIRGAGIAQYVVPSGPMLGPLDVSPWPMVFAL